MERGGPDATQSALTPFRSSFGQNGDGITKDLENGGRLLGGGRSPEFASRQRYEPRGGMGAHTRVPRKQGGQSDDEEDVPDLPVSNASKIAAMAPARQTAVASRRQATPSRGGAAADCPRRSFSRSLRADGKCFAMCLAGVLELEKLEEKVRLEKRSERPSSGIPASGFQLPGLRDVFVDGRSFGTGADLVIHLRLMKQASSSPAPLSLLADETEVAEPEGKDLFVFRFGCLVCWKFSQEERDATKEWFKSQGLMQRAEVEIEEENMDYVFDLKASRNRNGEEEREEENDNAETLVAVKQDQIILTTTSTYERLSHSYALAQSVRLGVFEMKVDRSIERTRSIPEAMARDGEVSVDHTDLSRFMGELLMLRCDVNLHTDILDTPEIFWDEAEHYEPHYVACRAYLDVDKRVEILNQRLVVLKDLYDLLQNSLNVKHGNKLEIIIIILILLEVLLELAELLHDAWVG